MFINFIVVVWFSSTHFSHDTLVPLELSCIIFGTRGLVGIWLLVVHRLIGDERLITQKMKRQSNSVMIYLVQRSEDRILEPQDQMLQKILRHLDALEANRILLGLKQMIGLKIPHNHILQKSHLDFIRSLSIIPISKISWTWKQPRERSWPDSRKS